LNIDGELRTTLIFRATFADEFSMSNQKNTLSALELKYIPFGIYQSPLGLISSQESDNLLNLKGKIPDSNSLQKYTLLIKLNLGD
jgi:hypothetical protein